MLQKIEPERNAQVSYCMYFLRVYLENIDHEDPGKMPHNAAFHESTLFAMTKIIFSARNTFLCGNYNMQSLMYTADEIIRVKSGKFGQTAKFGQPLCFIVQLLE